jgi:hypothetical protein
MRLAKKIINSHELRAPSLHAHNSIKSKFCVFPYPEYAIRVSLKGKKDGASKTKRYGMGAARVYLASDFTTVGRSYCCYNLL